MTADIPDAAVEAPPPITSLTDWWVGADDKGRPTVTLNLGSKDEARAWAVWLLDRALPPPAIER